MRLRLLRRLTLPLCAWFLLASPALALDCSVQQPCTFFWNANTESDLAGYRFYVKPVTGTYGPPLDITQPQSAIGAELFITSFGSLSAGDYVASVSAYDRAGNESGKSNEVRFTFVAVDLPPAVPTLQIYVTVP